MGLLTSLLIFPPSLFYIPWKRYRVNFLQEPNWSSNPSSFFSLFVGVLRCTLLPCFLISFRHYLGSYDGGGVGKLCLSSQNLSVAGTLSWGYVGQGNKLNIVVEDGRHSVSWVQTNFDYNTKTSVDKWRQTLLLLSLETDVLVLDSVKKSDEGLRYLGLIGSTEIYK